MQSYKVAAQSYKVAAQSYKVAAQGYKAAAQGYKVAAQGYKVAEQGYQAAAQGYKVSGKAGFRKVSDTVLITGGSTRIVATGPMKLPKAGPVVGALLQVVLVVGSSVGDSARPGRA